MLDSYTLRAEKYTYILAHNLSAKIVNSRLSGIESSGILMQLVQVWKKIHHFIKPS
jgi:hypothetical protein